MKNKLIEWNIYEINSKKHRLTQNRVRGRLRKFALLNNINLLTENTEKGEPRVRFAIISGEDISKIKNFLINLFDDVKVDLVREKIKNPVLSKLKINLEHRYEI